MTPAPRPIASYSDVWLAGVIIPPVFFVIIAVWSVVYYRKIRTLVESYTIHRSAAERRRSSTEGWSTQGEPDATPPRMEERRRSRIPPNLIIHPSPDSDLPTSFRQFPDPPRSAPLYYSIHSPTTTLSRSGSRVLSKRRRPVSAGHGGTRSLVEKTQKQKNIFGVDDVEGVGIFSFEGGDREEEIQPYPCDLDREDLSQRTSALPFSAANQTGDFYSQSNSHLRRRSATWSNHRPPIRPDMERLGSSGNPLTSDDSCGTTHMGGYGSQESGQSRRGLLGSREGRDEGARHYSPTHTSVPIPTELETHASTSSHRPSNLALAQSFDAPYIIHHTNHPPHLEHSPTMSRSSSGPKSDSSPMSIPTPPRRYSRASLSGLINKPDQLPSRYSSADLYPLEARTPSDGSDQHSQTQSQSRQRESSAASDATTMPPRLSVVLPLPEEGLPPSRRSSSGRNVEGQVHSPSTSVFSQHTFGNRVSAPSPPALPPPTIGAANEKDTQDPGRENEQSENQLGAEQDPPFSSARPGLRWVLDRMDSSGTLPMVMEPTHTLVVCFLLIFRYLQQK